MSGPKHVVLYSDDPEYGGVAQYNNCVLLALRGQGYEVTCIQPRSDSPLVRQQRAAGIRHIWVGYDTKKEFARTITDVADAEAVFSQVRPDVVLFSDCCPVSNIAAKHVVIARQIPFLIGVHFCAPYLAERFAPCLPVLRRQHAMAAAVIAVSHENLDELEALYGTPPGKGFVIYYGRPAAFFDEPAPEVRARVRAQLRIQSDAVVCFTAARLTAVKGFQYTIAAARLLKTAPVFKRMLFVWAGDGEARCELERAIAAQGLTDRFRLLGQRWDTPDLYAASDIFILPSHSEGMPLTIMEAMARRLPVIASAVSGIPEELADCGCLLPDPVQDAAGTVQELAKALLRLGERPVERRELGRRGHERALQLFREDQMLHRVLGSIREVLDATAAGRPPCFAPHQVVRVAG